MITVRHSVGSAKPKIKTFDTWQDAIVYCSTIKFEMFVWFDAREGDRFFSYSSGCPTGDPVGTNWSDKELRDMFVEYANNNL